MSAIIPPGVAHIDAVQSASFESAAVLLDVQGFMASIVFDFLIKAGGKSDIYESDFKNFPHVTLPDEAKYRVLQLNCLSRFYADFWNDAVKGLEHNRRTHSQNAEHNVASTTFYSSWDPSIPLRSEFARRTALVEIDVLVAQALGLTLDQLIEIYRIYFPVLQENEAGTWYDQNGRIVWTCSKGLPGVGWLDDRGKSPGRAAWEKILADNPAELTCTAIDDTMPGGPREVIRHFVGPFTQCDRIEDYKRAWAHFERLKSVEAAE